MTLVGWWQLEGDATNEVGDYPSYEVGNVSYSSAKVGDGYDNTANNGTGIELIRHDSFVEYEAYYSWSLWFKSTTTSGAGGERILSRDASEYPTIILDQNEASPQTLDFYEATGTNSTSVSANKWHHLAFSIDVGENESKLYIDGDLVATGGYNDSTLSRPYVLGGNTEGDGDISGGHFVGKIDDVRLYDHVLSNREVKQLSRAKVLHYKLDQEDYIDTVPDESGQGYNGDVVRTPVSTTDSAIGLKAMDTGTGSNAVTTTPPDFSAPNEVTVSVWAKSNEASWNNTGTIVSKRNQFIVYPSGGSQHVELYVHTAQNSWKSVTVYPDDIQTWNHYALTFEDGTLTAYLNAEQIGTNNAGADLESDTGLVTIGRDDDGDTSYGNEKIDDVRLYSEALSDAEIQELYETRASIDAGGTTHAHEISESEDRFDEFVGSVRDDTEILGSQDGFETVYFLDATTNTSYEDFITNRVTTSDWDNSGAGNYLYLILWLKGNQFPDGGFRGTYIKNPTPDTNTYQQYILRSDGQNSLDEYFRLFYDNNDDTSYSYIGDPKIYTESVYDNRTQLQSTGEYTFDAFNEVGPAPESLVGWWPLDGNTQDYSENANDGTNNGATVTSGLGQSAYDFVDSENDNIQVPSSSVFTEKSVSISVWMKPSSSHSGTTRIVYHEGDDSAMILADGSDLSIEHRAGSGDFSNAGSVTPDQWNHVVFVWDDSTDTYYNYTNGSLDASGSMGGGYFSDNNGGLDIGTGHWTNDSSYFLGQLQDIRFHDRTLTSEEVEQLYLLTDPRTDQQLMQTQDGRALAKEQFNELM